MIDIAAIIRSLPPIVEGPANLLDTGVHVGKLLAWEEKQNGLGERRVLLTFFVKDSHVSSGHLLYHNLLTNPLAAWRWGEFAKAFRAANGGDLYNLIGQSCRLGIRKREHPWRGTMCNVITALHPLTDDIPLTEVEPECTGCCRLHCGH